MDSHFIDIADYEDSDFDEIARRVYSLVCCVDFSQPGFSLLRLQPDEFLEDYNPMYEKGLEKLAPFVTEVKEFDRSLFQILIINNSSNPLLEADRRWQGVLHSATVADHEAPRVINSTCVAPSGFSDINLVSAAQVAEFLEMKQMSGTYK